MHAKKVAPSTEWETIKSKASTRNLRNASSVRSSTAIGISRCSLRAFAAHIVFHPDIVGGIRENGGGFLSGEERVIGLRIQCVPAEEAVAAKGPQVVGAGYRRTLGNLKFVRGIRGFVWRFERLNPQIDLGRLEARRLDLEIEGICPKAPSEQSPLCDRPSSSGPSACCRPACRLWPAARSDARGGSPAPRRAQAAVPLPSGRAPLRSGSPCRPKWGR